ncbi:phage holin family protein [Clostridium botulinum]|nr:phage holin family protein [Clostridium botulinum]
MKWNRILSTIIAGAGAYANYFFGGLDKALKTLLLLMILDYISGLICAGKDKTISSSAGFKGLGKKIIILIIVGVGVSIDNVTGAQGMIRSMVIFFYASMEGISILENATRVGVPVPDGLKNMLIQLKEGNKKEIHK